LPTPCNDQSDPCYSTDWSDPPSFISFQPFDNIPTCSLHVAYVYRMCEWEENSITYKKYEVQILRVISEGTCLGYDDLHTMISKSLDKIVDDNEMNYPPYEWPDCSLDWRFQVHSCWTGRQWMCFPDPFPWELFPNLPQDKMKKSDETNQILRVGLAPLTIEVPCYSTSCCYQEMEVCRDINGKASVIWLGDVYGDEWPDNCITTSPPILWELMPFVGWSSERSCYSICADFASSRINTKEINAQKDNLNINVKLNEHNFILKIDIISNNKIDISAKITNIKGDELENSLLKLNNGINTFEKDLSNLISGTYFYNIYSEGNLIKSSKVIIIK
jgi:hypothetical protein